MLVAGGWNIYTGSPRTVRALYAAALPMLGLHHLLAQGAVSVVPAWLPLRAAWLYLTAFALMAAGVAIVLGILARTAARLEAIMITAFVVLVHVPGVVEDPGDPLQWTMLVVASAIAGAAWIVAESYARPQSARSITSSSALPNAAASGTWPATRHAGDDVRRLDSRTSLTSCSIAVRSATSRSPSSLRCSSTFAASALRSSSEPGWTSPRPIDLSGLPWNLGSRSSQISSIGSENRRTS